MIRDKVLQTMTEWCLLYDIVASFWLDVGEKINKYAGVDTRTCVHMVQPYIDEDGAHFYITEWNIQMDELGGQFRISLDELLAGPEAYFEKWKKACTWPLE